MTNPQIALSKDFMEAYSRLPRKIQKKVREFTEKFQQDPTQSGINFEKIGIARDPKVRSVRIDQAYRAIVVHPPKGDVYLCVWVDHHDDAYKWVQDRVFEVNPRVGNFQIFELKEGEAVTPESGVDAAVATGTRGLFDDHDDEDLLIGGVPEPLLASVRALRTEDDLDALTPHLPPDAAEVLVGLVAGYSLTEAIEESGRAKAEPETVDVEDFQTALDKPVSKERFKVVTDEDDLEAMLDAPLEQWRVFLHPSQRSVVEMNANGPVRVLGGAGTGKTVALMHRANHLAANVFTKDSDRLLVTTFTRNLALDLRMNLRNLCSDEVFKRLEVTNLHSWCVRFMRRQGQEFAIAGEAERRELFELGMTEAVDDSFDMEFYMDEWEKIVQAQDVLARDDYLTARRVGRGTRLSRRQRADVWVVLSRYRQLLADEGKAEWPDVVRETRMFIEKQNTPLPYAAVLSDEVQDFSASELKLLRTIAPDGANTLFLVGDGHQRIYGQPVTLGSCGIEIRGRSRRLKINYRTTEQIRDRAVAILEGREIDDLDGGVDTLRGYQSLRSGPPPEFCHFATESEEAAFVVKKVREWLDTGVPGTAICVSARTGSLLAERYAPMLAAQGIDTVTVKKDPESESLQPGVRLATMHRMKGLEFSRVLLASVQGGVVPHEGHSAGDNASSDANELLERCLLYVASTRARDELVVTGYGKPSALIV